MDDRTLPIPKVRTARSKRGSHLREDWNAQSFGSSLFQQTGECVFIIGLDLRYIAANQRALQMLGYAADELAGMSVGEVMTMEALPETQSAEGTQVNLYERILKRKDGALIPVEVSASVVSDEKGAPAYIQSIVRDITERKTTEKLLKRSGRILSVIGEATARLFQSSNIQSRIAEMLESLGRALEIDCCVLFDVDSFAGRTEMRVEYKWIDDTEAAFEIEPAVHPFLTTLAAEPQKVFSTTASQSFAFVAIPVRGVPGSWTFLGLFDREHGLAWLPDDLATLQTAANLIAAALQRIQYEETIRLSESRNRAIVDTIPDLLLRLNADGVILDYSARPDHSLYVHRDLIAGKKLDETWPAEVVARIRGDENRAGFQAAHLVEGFQFPFSSGVFESRLQPINPNEALIMIRDISDMLRLNEMKTDFINRASHELRTPLTAAILMTELIQQGGTAEELAEYWRTLSNELNRQKSLIDRLLMAGRLESGMVKLEAQPLDLIAVLNESIRAVKPIADQKHVTLDLRTPSEAMRALGDRGALEQVFINLINNATKFSPGSAAVEVVVSQAGSSVHVEIVDHGMGIAPDALPHLFEKFYRARNVTIAEIPGSGIGLYIVKSILEELGGGIEVQSELHNGTSFIVKLRAAPG